MNKLQYLESLASTDIMQLREDVNFEVLQAKIDIAKIALEVINDLKQPLIFDSSKSNVNIIISRGGGGGGGTGSGEIENL